MINQTLITGVVTFTALTSFLNYRFFKLPKTIGVTLITFCFALSFIILLKFDVGFIEPVVQCLSGVDFNQTVLHGIICYILFASSLNINRVDLNQFKWLIFCLSTVSVLISSVLVGISTWCILQIFSQPISIYYCLAFGALISPTDPIAVLSSLKKIKKNNSLKIKFAGEALFNDGIGIVLFLVFYQMGLSQNQTFSFLHALNYFIQSAIGGIVFGAFLGYFGKWTLSKIKDAHELLLFSLALVTGGFTLSDSVLNVSGVLAMAVCGLIIGSNLKDIMPEKVLKEAFENIWDMIDEFLNTILFVLIGLECLTIHFSIEIILACFAVIGIVLGSRTLSLSVPIYLIPKFKSQNQPQEIWLLSWGGLRGGISIALALSLQINQSTNDVIIALTYGVVLFSLVVQGLTIEPFMRKFKLI